MGNSPAFVAMGECQLPHPFPLARNFRVLFFVYCCAAAGEAATAAAAAAIHEKNTGNYWPYFTAYHEFSA